MKKSPNAFRTISEVATWLATPAHVLRFWESRFPEVAPVKRAGGRRYYRPDDMLLLGGIKHLLHTEGHTIKSVQDRLQSEGIQAIAVFSQPLDQNATLPAPVPEATTEASVETAPATPKPAVDTAQQDHPTLPLFDPNTVVSESAPTPKEVATPSLGEDELPPIGFFFDDSDDAAPAEDQSGTFASSLPSMDTSPTDTAATADTVIDPAANVPLPADVMTMPPLPGTTHALRTLIPAQLTVSQRARFRHCAQRLSML